MSDLTKLILKRIARRQVYLYFSFRISYAGAYLEQLQTDGVEQCLGQGCVFKVPHAESMREHISHAVHEYTKRVDGKPCA